MELRLTIYFLLVLCAWTVAIEDPLAVSLQSTNTSESKSVQQMGPAKSSPDSKPKTEELLLEIPAAMTTSQDDRPIELKEKPADIAEHSRFSQDAKPLNSADKMVHVAGPAEPTPTPKPQNWLADVMPGGKSTDGVDMPLGVIFKRLIANFTNFDSANNQK